MNEALIKRYSLLEIALLAVFAAGLFCAFLIVKTSRKIVLSEPITLTGSGLTISLPDGPEWQSTGSWQLENDNSVNFVTEHLGYRRRDIQVRWRYVMACEPLTPEQLLQNRAKTMGIEIQEILQTSGSHPMHYTRFFLSQQEEGFEFILGILPLDFGRRIELHVRGYHPFDDMYERVFFALAEQLTYTMPEDLDRGLKLMAAFTADPPALSQSQESNTTAFLIKDALSRNLGYYTLEKSASQYQSQYFELRNQRRLSNLRFKQWPDAFFWKTTVQFRGIREPAVFNIQTDAEQNITIKSEPDHEQAFHRDHFMLPDLLLLEFAQFFIDSAHDRVSIDTLNHRGSILPVRLSKIPLERAHAKSDQIVSVIRVESPYSEGVFEELYFDQSQHIIGKYVNKSRRRIQLWDVTTTQQLEELFKKNYQQSAAPFACVNVMNLN